MGVTPPLRETIFIGQPEVLGDFNILSDGEKNLRIEAHGSLAPYIFFSNGEQILEAHTSNELLVEYALRLPADLKPGTYYTEIITSQYFTPEEIVQGGGSSAFAAVSHILKIRVPNDGKFLEASFEYEPRRIQPGTIVYFTLPLLNFGTEELTDLWTEIEVTAPDGTVVARSPTSHLPTLAVAERAPLRAYWDTKGQQSGEYTASAAIDYGGKSPAQLSTTLRIGEIKILITAVTTDLLGDIAKIHIDLESNWNSGIEDVYAVVTVKQGGAVIDTLKTSSLTLESWGTGRLTAFWEHGQLPPGTYDLDIRVFYYDKQAGKEAQVTLEETEEQPAPFFKNSLLLVLIILLALLVLLNAGWILFRSRKKR